MTPGYFCWRYESGQAGVGGHSADAYQMDVGRLAEHSESPFSRTSCPAGLLRCHQQCRRGPRRHDLCGPYLTPASSTTSTAMAPIASRASRISCATLLRQRGCLPSVVTPDRSDHDHVSAPPRCPKPKRMAAPRTGARPVTMARRLVQNEFHHRPSAVLVQRCSARSFTIDAAAYRHHAPVVRATPFAA